MTATANRQALDPDEDATGNTVAYLDGHATWRSRVPTTELPQESYEHRFTPHAATCLYGPKTLTTDRLPDGVASLAEHRRKRSSR
jgi:hypothetical protein